MTGRELMGRREALGYSRSLFAEILGLERQIVDEWENENPPADEVEQLCSALEALEKNEAAFRRFRSGLALDATLDNPSRLNRWTTAGNQK
ncbi:MAG TPA: hypothetical protein VM534_05715 [Thermoanaerobaculia bacterium]|nr:hypothetical protein [Thermoanaerobaculia bacterium]